jgi:hypothetical protein
MKLTTVLFACLLAIPASAQLWIPNVIWDKSGAGDHSRYGGRIFSLGDQNNDGFADFGVEAFGSGGPGQPSEACTELFHGGNPPETTPYMRFAGNGDLNIVFYAGFAAGDINGDDHTDWLTATGYADSTWYWCKIYYGGPEADTIPDFTMILPISQGTDPMGDFNGDGYDDFYIFDTNTGIAVVLFGGNPMDSVPDWRMSGPLALMRGFGDINGDGFGDMLDYNDTPGLNIFYGGAHPDTVPGQAVTGVVGDFKFVVNDLNGDGRAEIILAGEPTSDIYFGRDSLRNTSDYHVNFLCPFGGGSPYSIGDVNRDEYNDFAMLTDYCQDSWWGTVSIYLGHPWINSEPVLTIRGRDWPLNLVGIYSAAGVGDVNGDGVNDFAIGAFNSDADGWRGRVVIISGDSTVRVNAREPYAELPRSLSVSVYPNPFNGQASISLNLPQFSPEVSLTVYNLLGQEIQRIILQNAIGSIHCNLNAGALSSGVYLLRVDSGFAVNTQKLVVMK